MSNWVITDKVYGVSYDTDHDGYETLAEQLYLFPDNFSDVTDEEKRRIMEGAMLLGWRHS